MDYLFRKLLSHRFSSSMSSVAGSDISELLSHPSITYGRWSGILEICRTFSKGLQKISFPCSAAGVRYVGGSVATQVFWDHPEYFSLVHRKLPFQLYSSLASLVEVGQFGASVSSHSYILWPYRPWFQLVFSKLPACSAVVRHFGTSVRPTLKRLPVPIHVFWEYAEHVYWVTVGFLS